MDFIIQRLKEPSTYAGLAAVIGGMSFIPDAGAWAHVVTLAGATIAAVLAIVLPENKQ